METEKVRTIEQAHRVARSSKRHDKTPLSLKEKPGCACYRCGLEYLHVSAFPAIGHKCQKCNRDNHFACVCMGGHIKVERGRHARPCVATSRHAQHVKAYNCSSSTDSDVVSTLDAKKCLFKMSDAQAHKRQSEQVQLIDK
ncbi:hypothetical protein NDU88_004735 [Pleurodeles waltl]|uniref:Uncharacterized protein n=1 Tax=Pleurodeles waltl TaxID=8319 RepID=A0AAV7SJM4_PLEWA|nr:hypothetical protein NDU88_004735 [Pleurodeles waltl]